MKKRAIAILLALAMMVTFMPTMAFADAGDVNQDIKDWHSNEDVDKYISERNHEIIEWAKVLSEFLRQYSKEIDYYQKLVNKLFDAAQEGKFYEFKEYTDMLDDLIGQGNKLAEYLADKPEVQAQVEEFIKAAKLVQAQVAKYGELEDMTPEQAKAQLEILNKQLMEAVQNMDLSYQAVMGYLAKDFTEELNAFVANAKAQIAAQDLGDNTKELLYWFLDEAVELYALGVEQQAFVVEFQHQLVAFQKIAKQYHDKAVEIYDEQYEKAVEFYNEHIDEINAAYAVAKDVFEEISKTTTDDIDAMVQAAMAELMEKYEAGELDFIFEELGTTREEVEKIIEDIMNIVIGYSLGYTYTDLLNENEALMAQCDELQDKAIQLQEQLAMLTDDLAKVKANYKAFVKKANNAMKVVAKKVTLKSKATKAGKKKITVKWKKLKGATLTKYQVYYKQKGKKAKKVYAKKSATKKVIKKLKKGKTYTVKVRGVYKYTYTNADGKKITKTKYTRWSKSKKVKVK
jgi:hypothetical protein